MKFAALPLWRCELFLIRSIIGRSIGWVFPVFPVFLLPCSTTELNFT